MNRVRPELHFQTVPHSRIMLVARPSDLPRQTLVSQAMVRCSKQRTNVISEQIGCRVWIALCKRPQSNSICIRLTRLFGAPCKSSGGLFTSSIDGSDCLDETRARNNSFLRISRQNRQKSRQIARYTCSKRNRVRVLGCIYILFGSP